MGEPKHARRYCGKLAPSVDCLTDPGTEPYKAYGLRRAKGGEVMSFDVMRAGMRATAEGFTAGAPSGDVMMMPGNFIVDRDGIVRYVFKAKHIADHPRIKDVVAVGRELRGESETAELTNETSNHDDE